MASWLIYHEKPITLHSGGKSHWFVDGQAIFDDSNLRESVLNLWARAIAHPDETHFMGIPRGGIPWAEAIARKVGARWGTPSQAIRGAKYLYVVDDVVTTGASLDSIPEAYHRFAVVVRAAPGFFRRLTAWAWIDLEMLPASRESKYA